MLEFILRLFAGESGSEKSVKNHGGHESIFLHKIIVCIFRCVESSTAIGCLVVGGLSGW